MAQQSTERRSGGKGKFAAGHISVQGNVGTDPREVNGANDSIGAAFRLGCPSRNHRGEDHTTWFDVIIWGFRAEGVLQKVKKGMRVDVSGQLFGDEYDGQEKTSIEAVTVAIVPWFDEDEDDRGSRRRRSRDDDDDDDGERRSRRGSRRSRDDDDDDDDYDERPARRRRSRDDDDDDDDYDERPARRPRRSTRNDGDDLDD